MHVKSDGLSFAEHDDDDDDDDEGNPRASVPGHTMMSIFVCCATHSQV
jgi:hypothetical protein